MEIKNCLRLYVILQCSSETQKVYELECKQCFPTVVSSDSVKKQLMKYLILLVRKYIK